MINKLWSHRVFRFVTIGIINTLTDLSILNFLVFAFGIKELFANLVSASISITLSYFWNHYFVFRHHQPISFKLFIRFFVITAVGILAIQSAIIAGFDHFISIHQIISNLKISHTLAKVVQTEGSKLLAVAVSMVWNFFLYTFAVFKDRDEGESDGVVPY